MWGMTQLDAPLVDAPAWVPKDTFGARLALVRQMKHWNVKEAADACGVNAQSWTNWEHGGGCRQMETVARQIVDATGCDYVWLMAGGPLRSRCFSALPDPADPQMELPLFVADRVLVAV